MNERAGPERPAQAPVSSRNATAQIVPDRADHRRRQIQPLAVIALVRAAYGASADLRSPPGPAVCPADCPWCGAA
jgi:hypothetical protein